jgi:hypothetical protein
MGSSPDLCTNKCVDLANDQNNCGACGHDCTTLPNVKPGATGIRCVSRVCSIPAAACVSGYAHCSAQPDDGCEANLTEARTCGSCTNPCPATAPVCSTATSPFSCVPNCTGSTPMLCGTKCVNPQTDYKNCGACNFDCSALPNVKAGSMPPAVQCVSGACSVQPSGCVNGSGHCSTNPNDGCETDLTRPVTCGSCGNQCMAPLGLCSAMSGQLMCSSSCMAPNPDICGSSCVSLASDPTHCGTCAHDCTSLPHLKAGAMPTCNGNGGCAVPQTACAAGFANCSTNANDTDGCETPTNTTTNCGGCGNVCYAFQICTGTACSPRFGEAYSIDIQALGGYQAVGTNAAAMTADGSYFYAGGFFGQGALNPGGPPQSVGAPTAGVTKVRNDGVFLWTVLIPIATPGYDLASSYVGGVAALSDGGVIGFGSYLNDPGGSVTIGGMTFTDSQSMFAFRLDASGAFVWVKRWTVTGGTAGITRMALTPGGTAVFVGGFSGTMNLNPATTPAANRTASGGDGFVLSLDLNGNYLWGGAIGGSGSDSVTSVAVGPDGGVWLAGFFHSGANLNPGISGAPDTRTSQSTSDSFLIRLMSNGGYVNAWTLMGSVKDIAAGSDSSAYVVGQYAGSGIDLDPTTAVQSFNATGASDGFVLKLGPTGTLGWINRLVGSGNDVLSSVGVTGDGTVVAAGAISGSSSATLSSAIAPRTLDGTASSLVAARIAPDGSYVWSLAFGGLMAGVHALGVSSAGFVVTGNFTDTADYDPGPGVKTLTTNVPGGGAYVTRYNF